MGVPVKFIKCTLAELQEREPDAKKVDIYMKDGKLFFIEDRNEGNTFESIDKFEVIKEGNEFILK